MKKLICSLLLISCQAFAETKCFLAEENGKILIEKGDCKARHAPCSTFKIAISLMGYNEGILLSEAHPEALFKRGYADTFEAWKKPQTPKTWMQNSCIWYSRWITDKLGEKTFENYVKNLHYGNEDASGDKGKKNGLTHSWLSSSLQISPEEQVRFLKNLLEDKLSVSKRAHEQTRNLLFLEDFADGRLYGKTGTGRVKSGQSRIQSGWFVGWLQKTGSRIIFAHYTEELDAADLLSGRRAKEQAKTFLSQIQAKKHLPKKF